jgi:PTS system nitrogen regulatory IIA component
MEQWSCFGAGTVVLRLSSRNKFDAIREVVQSAPVFRSLPDSDGFERAVINREKLQTTGFGHGVAVAHGKTETVDGIRIALGIAPDGIPFDAVDGEPVNLLFVVANPPGKQLEYLTALSSLVKIVRDADFRDQLLCSTTVADVERKLCDAFSRDMSTRRRQQVALP